MSIQQPEFSRTCGEAQLQPETAYPLRAISIQRVRLDGRPILLENVVYCTKWVALLSNGQRLEASDLGTLVRLLNEAFDDAEGLNYSYGEDEP